MFEPIAIIGRACVLPGALTPAQLWEAVLAKANCLSYAIATEWRLDPKSILTTPDVVLSNHTFTDICGRIAGFETVFNPEGFQLPAATILQQDRLCQWLLYTARMALQDAGYVATAGRLPITGLIVGNLSYPSDSLSKYAESVWLTDQSAEVIGEHAYTRLLSERPHDENRFMSGLPIFNTANALGLTGTSYAIDAACASSLYAIKLACDELQDGKVEMMLAGGVNAADSLLLNVGFTALRALSRSGQSKPLQRDADGLIPANGAGLVVLKRLKDAISSNDPILGVIRGVGLSNDGSGRGFLMPSEKGQIAAMRQAYEISGMQPDDISWVECHATGTVVGDATEVNSMQSIFQQPELTVGALKANIGHSITASGIAAVINTLSAFQAELKPPTRYVQDNLADSIDHSAFRVLDQPEFWQAHQGRRIAAINSFGFGGNNAHLILEQWQPGRKAPAIQPITKLTEVEDIAIVGIGVIAANAENRQAFTDSIFNAVSLIHQNQETGITGGCSESVDLSIKDCRFPPADLQRTIGQQLLILKAAQAAITEVKAWNPARSSVLVGMECDPSIARFNLSNRLKDLLPELDAEWIKAAQAIIHSSLQAADAIGAMPNIVANRINAQFDCIKPSYSVSAEEASGLVALEIGIRDLRTHSIDLALVGAVDVCCETVNITALQKVLDITRHIPGDAAVMFALKRLSDARAQGDTIYAVIPSVSKEEPSLNLSLNNSVITPLMGYSHAASGLLHVAAAVLACHEQLLPAKITGQPIPWVSDVNVKRTARVAIDTLGGMSKTVIVQEYDTKPRCSSLTKTTKPLLRVYSGDNRADILQALLTTQESNVGPTRLVIVGRDLTELNRQCEIAKQWLSQSDETVTVPPGMYFRIQPLAGELAFVFTGATTSYAGMGRDLLLRFPQLTHRADISGKGLQEVINLWASLSANSTLTMFDELKTSSLLAQTHAGLSQKILNLKPQACIGYCSGETNALVAMQAWLDTEQLHADIDTAKIYTDSMCGNYSVLGSNWPAVSADQAKWVGWRVFANVAAVREVVATVPYARLTIINTASDCIIAGHPDACEQVLIKLQRPQAKKLPYNMVIHCPEFRPVADLWRQIHYRKTYPVKDIRFYSAGSSQCYTPTADKAADALLSHALDTVDFPAVINQAWQDGVRIFLEHGPRDLCSRWIKEILRDKPHLAVSLDMLGTDPMLQIVHTAAQLLAAGVPLNYAIFQEEA